MGLLIGLWMIRSADDDSVAGRQPGYFANVPLGIRKGFSLAGGYSEQPQSGLLVLFVYDVRVIFVFFFFFLGVGLGIRSEKSDLLAVRRPRKTAHTALALG